MAWTTVFTPNTDRDRVGRIDATWTEPTGEVFVYSDEQVNTKQADAKANFVTKAKAKLAAWQADLTKAKSNALAITTEMDGLLNG